MTIDNYLNKPFRIDGRKFYIAEVHDHLRVHNGYILCNIQDDHVANVSQITDQGFGWFTYVLGVEVQGFIKYVDLEQKLIIN
ncbi:hypothetical protein [Chitinophaga ginsengisegetis]|uniref:hypothetical protein n=1 Tax=Chitinophaga ginsengisegetis TaxID=393003 RepID=UPI000DBA7765|nr:hypothetical protein [Chitinophaga ginsengisegetis]MDR6565491.1 putative GNAT superfamily acetyltransferase [Chitinophaga ginsengisegetis]MDR6645219.1 putative GNAT superfamily acetyltransferase [Chitinophaga ginsengisegetis]MDR6652189.1 putative GNAT superfamily acetyltransferase [Chitinophaga ginsengisegetis]